MNGQTKELWCWWCCHPIVGEILHLPKTYVETHRSYIVYGNFCSFGCMKTFNNNENGSYKQNQSTLISKLMRETYGYHKEVTPAPPRECLKVFGGELDISGFRSVQDVTHIVFVPPLMSQTRTTEIQKKTSYRWINPADENNKDKCYTLKEFEDSQISKVSNIPMKIKNQSAASTVKTNTLEKIMGLKARNDSKQS